MNATAAGLPNTENGPALTYTSQSLVPTGAVAVSPQWRSRGNLP